ncbi:MAG: DUF2523 domain-containing protein [Curvibacter sp.]|jgi:hypothetical protein|nr:MAG: DUF2523 domain-containing protein [Curvibacter sp.]
MNFAAFLASMAAPIVSRVLMALGFSVITVTGVSVAIDQLKNLILTNLGTANTNILQLAGLIGCWQGLGMIFGAVTFAITLRGLTSLSGWIGKA